MPKRRANGEGNIRKRKDGRWEGRYTVGHDSETGKAIIKNVLGKTQAEVKEKLKRAIEENVGIDYPGSVDGDRNYVSTRFTALTDEDYYSDGRIGRLSIPALDVNEKIYEGTSNTSMAKGVAHFSSTSIWNGNVALAGHNRGSNDVFKSIHKLETGDKITLTTKNGTRTYSVYSVTKVAESDTSCLDATYDNILTLVTCVRNQYEYRYVVRAREA